MKNYEWIATALLLVYFGGFSKCATQLSDPNGGRFKSPNFPNPYPRSTMHRWYIKAPQNHRIALTFTAFYTGPLGPYGERRDYVKIIDGRTNESPEEHVIEGSPRLPIRFVSKTNRLHVRLIAGFIGYQGFFATYSFFPTSTYCNVTTLPSNTVVTSCSNEVNGFATDCQLECLEHFRLQGSGTAVCENGEFTPVNCVEYCDVTMVSETNQAVTSCADESEGFASQCDLECAQNYTLVGSTESVCSNGFLTPINCQPIDELITRCENTDMVDCPYTWEEIVKYFSQNRIPADEALSQEQLHEETATLDTVPSPLDASAGRGSTQFVCKTYYCAKKYTGRTVTYPFKCGRCKWPRTRQACFFCRYKSKCNRPPPPSVFY